MTSAPLLTCPHCGVLTQAVLSPGTGPHAAAVAGPAPARHAWAEAGLLSSHGLTGETLHGRVTLGHAAEALGSHRTVS
jgi:hypothetical protein